MIRDRRCGEPGARDWEKTLPPKWVRRPWSRPWRGAEEGGIENSGQFTIICAMAGVACGGAAAAHTPWHPFAPAGVGFRGGTWVCAPTRTNQRGRMQGWRGAESGHPKACRMSGQAPYLGSRHRRSGTRTATAPAAAGPRDLLTNKARGGEGECGGSRRALEGAPEVQAPGTRDSSHGGTMRAPTTSGQSGPRHGVRQPDFRVTRFPGHFVAPRRSRGRRRGRARRAGIRKEAAAAAPTGALPKPRPRLDRLSTRFSVSPRFTTHNTHPKVRRHCFGTAVCAAPKPLCTDCADLQASCP
jgi:hypothetical protein